MNDITSRLFDLYLFIFGWLNFEGREQYIIFLRDYRTNIESIVHNWKEANVSEVVLKFLKEGLVNYCQNSLGIWEEKFNSKYSGASGDKQHIQKS